MFLIVRFYIFFMHILSVTVHLPLECKPPILEKRNTCYTVISGLT